MKLTKHTDYLIQLYTLRSELQSIIEVAKSNIASLEGQVDIVLTIQIRSTLESIGNQMHRLTEEIESVEVMEEAAILSGNYTEIHPFATGGMVNKSGEDPIIRS